MAFRPFEQLVIVGLGLIGSSLARGARAKGLANRILGVDQHQETRRRALELGLVDEIVAEVAELKPFANGGEQLVVLAVPVRQTQPVLGALKHLLGDGCLVSDTGSTKRDVLAAAAEVWGGSPPPFFVPAHPIAGSEQSGVNAGSAELFRERWVLITPHAETGAEGQQRVAGFWEELGARIEYMSAQHHDEVLGATSHLPHVLAYTLVDTLVSLESRREVFRYAAGGFRDFTRIAESDPRMWCDILLVNGDIVLDHIDNYINHLNNLKSFIEKKDEYSMRQMFGRAQEARRRFSRSGGGA